MGNKHHGSFDIAKFVLSVVIVAIHAGFAGGAESFIFPWARIAVPLFFMISGYLFFLGYIPKAPEQRKAKLTGFINRNIQLYLFWFILQFLPTFLFRHYYEYGAVKGILLFLWSFVIGDGFVASWYIAASVIAVCIVVILMRRISTFGLLCLFTPLYVLCCLFSNYGNLFANTKAFIYMNETVFQVISPPYNSFIVALFWITVAKALFEHRDSIEKYSKTTRGLSFLLLILIASLSLLGIEHMFVQSHSLSFVNDCYLILPIPCIVIFVLLLIIPCRIKGTEIMRAASTVTYCSHGTFLQASGFILRRTGISNASEWSCIVALVSCWMLTIAILRLEKDSDLRVLRYLH